MPTPPAARIASARHLRRSNSTAATSTSSDTAMPIPTRIDGVIHPRLVAITNSSTTPSVVATPPAQASVRAANSCSASLPQSRGGRGWRGGGAGREGRGGGTTLAVATAGATGAGPGAGAGCIDAARSSWSTRSVSIRTLMRRSWISRCV